MEKWLINLLMLFIFSASYAQQKSVVNVNEHEGHAHGLVIDSNVFYTTDLKANRQPLHGWTANWIIPDYTEDTIDRPPVVFSKSFSTNKKITFAKLFITCHGIYSASVNNQKVGNAFFTPGWTSYDRRLQYQQYDVTHLLKNTNNIEVTVAEGWWRGIFGGGNYSDNYGTDAGLLFQLQIAYADGSTDVIASDSSWKSATGPIRMADFYNGEMVDHSINSRKQYGVQVKFYSKDILVPTISEPVTKQQELSPVNIFTSPMGEQLVDFGQNISGWVRITVKGNAGDTVKISHAESLDKAGDFFTGNLRKAKAQDIYILKGNGKETFEPCFTYHGFRYAKIEGVHEPLIKDNFTAVAISSDLLHTGNFECSNQQINKLQSNIVWSQQDNFVDIPTDCPQRSERLGWTGDAEVFCRTAAFNRNVKNFFTKWLQDLVADQGSNGGVPNIIPDLYGHLNNGPKGGVAGWSDAATIVPWTLFDVYGDTNLLRTQYESMKAWVEYARSNSPDNLFMARGYGDWLAPDTIQTPVPFIDQCFYAYSTSLVMQAAEILNKREDADMYSGLLVNIKNAFLKTWPALPNTQTAQVLALWFDMLPDNRRQPVADHLAALVRANNNHLSTGFLGTPYILFVLSKFGYTDLAYTVLLQETPPSWLYPVKMGATTIWEKWDAIAPDGTPGEKSQNHYAYGAVGNWLYKIVAGIDAAAPGYKKIIIQPHTGGGLSWVKASYKCDYGTIVSNWKIKNHRLKMNVVIPKNTTATIIVPGKEPIEVGPGKYSF